MWIDAHQHNWRLDLFRYPWIKPGAAFHRDYLPEDGKALMDAAGVNTCVLVEADAGDPPGEIDWLLGLAARHPHIAGVVGRADLLSPGDEAALARAAPNPHFKGVRTWTPPHTDWDALADRMRLLAGLGLSCDLLLNAETLPHAARLIARNPGVTYVIDHFANPKMRAGGADMWAEMMKPLAALPNTVMKVSGYLTAAAETPLTLDVLRPYFEAALALFGADRLLYGSDWPVCTRDGGAYADTVALLRALVAPLSPAEQAAIANGTATRVYRL